MRIVISIILFLTASFGLSAPASARAWDVGTCSAIYKALAAAKTMPAFTDLLVKGNVYGYNSIDYAARNTEFRRRYAGDSGLNMIVAGGGKTPDMVAGDYVGGFVESISGGKLTKAISVMIELSKQCDKDESFTPTLFTASSLASPPVAAVLPGTDELSCLAVYSLGIRMAKPPETRTFFMKTTAMRAAYQKVSSASDGDTQRALNDKIRGIANGLGRENSNLDGIAPYVKACDARYP